MLPPASGTGQFVAKARKSIRFVRLGCANRPFFHIVVAQTKREQFTPVIEQVGSYDPLANQHNEKLISLNLERIRHWMGNGAEVSRPVAQLLGLSGLLPVHPTTYMEAWRARQAQEKSRSETESKEEGTAGNK